MRKVLIFTVLLVVLVGCENESDSNIETCSISNLEVDLGDCTSENTYNLTLDFDYQNPGSDSFDLYVRNNELIGTYNLSDLPLTLNDFQMSGVDEDYIKVCINDNPDCCAVIEFTPPDCEEEADCNISNLEVDLGDCTSANTYNLTLDFDYQNPGSDSFDLYVRNDELIGTYNLSDLPLTLNDFQMSGVDEDYIKVCINDNPDCCAVIEFTPPDCEEEGDCNISNLEVDLGDCTSANTYNLTLDFDYQNPGSDSFDLYVRNDELIGTYNLSDLPLTLNDFQMSGVDEDYIKVCINDNPDCCAVIEFTPPDCEEEGDCNISNLEVDLGNCTSENTYNLTLDFDYQNPGSDSFDLYVRNDELIGTYNLSDLPLTLNDFQMSGVDEDYIKVCINDNPDCCAVIEFTPPDCGT